MPVGDLPGWKQIFTDDFLTPIPVGSFPSGDQASGKWSSYPSPWKDTMKHGTYDARNISVHDGLLDVHMRYENGLWKVGAPMPNIGGAVDIRNQLYGRYAACFRVTNPAPGYKIAWLLWPKSEIWPRDGEIDFPEGDFDSNIDAYMHRQNGTSGGDQDVYDNIAPFGIGWHTVVTEWGPNACTFYLDGKVAGRSTQRIPNTPMRWVLQCETSLEAAYPPQDSSVHVLVDWVAVWKYAP